MPSQFDNLGCRELADAIGDLDHEIKSREARLDALKTEFKRRGVLSANGRVWTVSASTSTSKRLDTKRLRADLGDALDGYEVESTATRILIKLALDEVA